MYVRLSVLSIVFMHQGMFNCSLNTSVLVLYVFLSVLLIWSSVRPSVYKLIRMFLSVCMFVHLSVRLYANLYVRLFYILSVCMFASRFFV